MILMIVEVVKVKMKLKVSNDAIAKYRVAADLPRVITIEKLGVKARVLQMSVNRTVQCSHLSTSLMLDGIPAVLSQVS